MDNKSLNNLLKDKIKNRKAKSGNPFPVDSADGNFAATASVSHGGTAAATASATDEDTVIGEVIGECGWVIKEASDYIRDHRVGDFRDVDIDGNCEGEAKYQQAVELADRAALCRAYLKGISISLAADVSEPYMEHLIDVADSIAKSRLTGFTEPPIECISPDDFAPYGGFDSPDEYRARTGIVMEPPCVKGFKRTVLDLPSKPEKTAVAMYKYMNGSDGIHPYNPSPKAVCVPEEGAEEDAPADPPEEITTPFTSDLDSADAAVTCDSAKTIRDKQGRIIARGKKKGEKTVYRDSHGNRIATVVEDAAIEKIKTEVEKQKPRKDKYSDKIQFTIICRDGDSSLLELLEYIKDLGNVGHSFSIVVDPDMKENRKEFGWDGDGSDHIFDIVRRNLTAEEEELKDGKTPYGKYAKSLPPFDVTEDDDENFIVRDSKGIEVARCNWHNKNNLSAANVNAQLIAKALTEYLKEKPQIA